MPEAPTILGLSQVAACFRFTPAGLRHYVHNGELETIRLSERVIVVTLESFCRFVDLMVNQPGNRGSLKVKKWLRNEEERGFTSLLGKAYAKHVAAKYLAEREGE